MGQIFHSPSFFKGYFSTLSIVKSHCCTYSTYLGSDICETWLHFLSHALVLVFTTLLSFSSISLISVFLQPVSSFLSSGTNSCWAVSLWSVLRDTWNFSHSSFLFQSLTHTPLTYMPFLMLCPSLSLFSTETYSRHACEDVISETDTAFALHLKWPSKQLVCIMPLLVP